MKSSGAKSSHDATLPSVLPELFYEVDAENTSNKNLVNINIHFGDMFQAQKNINLSLSL